MPSGRAFGWVGSLGPAWGGLDREMGSTHAIPLSKRGPASMACVASIWCILVRGARRSGQCTQSSKLLPQGAPLILSGPYFRKDHPTAPTNLAFDESLKARNAEWSIRWLEDITELAEANGFALETVHEIPTNNLTAVYRRV